MYGHELQNKQYEHVIQCDGDGEWKPKPLWAWEEYPTCSSIGKKYMYTVTIAFLEGFLGQVYV